MQFAAKVRTCFWFDGDGEEAAVFYVSLLPESFIENVVRPDPNGPALVVEFTLCGAPYMVLNGGPMFPPTEAASISVLTEDQGETDRLWGALIADGGVEGRCGWLKDRFGLSWQIVPKVLPQLLSDSDPEAAARVSQAMMQMRKLEILALQAAFQKRMANGDDLA
jgi:predicted 3-demethylubiquinone-9 3-methyltransferase (glyoxalase superfamily)